MSILDWPGFDSETVDNLRHELVSSVWLNDLRVDQVNNHEVQLSWRENGRYVVTALYSPLVVSVLQHFCDAISLAMEHHHNVFADGQHPYAPPLSGGVAECLQRVLALHRRPWANVYGVGDEQSWTDFVRACYKTLLNIHSKPTISASFLGAVVPGWIPRTRKWCFDQTHLHEIVAFQDSKKVDK